MKSILVVDDELALTDQLVELLTYEGYEATYANSVPEALVLIRNSNFDLIIIDLMMPIENGLDLINQLPANHKSQIILMSASREPVVNQGKKGWDIFLRKPFDLDHLLKKVKQHSN